MKRKDLVGKVVGKLTVIENLGAKSEKNREYLWLCRCKCGKETKVTTSNLKKGRTKSCGCLKYEGIRKYNISRRGKYNPDQAKKHIYNSYKNNARLRKLPFDLSYEEFLHITTQNCNYCNLIPSNSIALKIGGSTFIYSGVDRIDSSLGYFKENCVPCCRRCNQAKNDMSVKEFYEWIDKVNAWRHHPKLQEEA